MEDKKGSRASAIIKGIGTAILFALCLLFVLRCCMVADKSVLADPVATDALRASYADGVIEMQTVKVELEMAEDGYFSAYGFCYDPESGEAQFAVRWNDSVYKYTDMPEGHEFTFFLWNETTGERVPTDALASDKRSIYNYRRLSAALPIDDASQITVVMELRDGFESTQVLKFAEQPMKPYKTPKGLFD